MKFAVRLNVKKTGPLLIETTQILKDQPVNVA
jgi:hypothetical protein